MSQRSIALKRKVKFVSAGSEIRDTFSYVYDDYYKTKRMVKTGQINYQDYIDASKDSTDINMIVQRAQNGNVASLNVMSGVYEDVSALPNNMQDLSKFADNLKADFNAFPDDVKNLFDNDYSQFVSKTMNGKINDILARYANEKIAAQNAKKEGVNNESNS